MADILYMAKVEDTYAHNNKLQKAIKEYILTNDRDIIYPDKLGLYKTTIINNINVICTQFPKCRRIDAHWWSPNRSGNKDWFLTLETFGNSGSLQLITFNIYFGKLLH